MCLALPTTVPVAAAAQDEPSEPQGPTPSQLTAGREQYRLGMAAVREGRYDDACDALQRAYDLVRRPRILFNLAGAQLEAGRLVAASESYRRFLREASAEDQNLRPQARQFMESLAARVPRVRVSIVNLADGDELRIDQEPVLASALEIPYPLDPGPHDLVAFRGGEEVAHVSFTLDEGETEDVSLELPRAVPRVVARDVAPVRDGPLDRSPRDTGAGGDRDADGGGLLSSPWFWAGAVIVVAGGVTAGILLTSGGGAPDPHEGNLPPGGWTF